MSSPKIKSESPVGAVENGSSPERLSIAESIDNTIKAGLLPVKGTVMGDSVCVKGDIAAKEDMLVNGRIEGSIALKGHCLEMGADAYIRANVFAKAVIINGELRGDIYASNQVVVRKTGSVIGNIYAPDVSVEEGAVLKGSIDMQKHGAPSHSTSAAASSIEDAEKPGSFAALFKRMQELAHLKVPEPGKAASHDPALGTATTSRNPVAPVVAAVASTYHESTDKLSSVELSSGAASQSDAQPMTAHAKSSFIGAGVIIKGDLVSKEDLIIHGKVEGIVGCKNHNLEIGADARLITKIFAKALVSQGEIRGDVYVRDYVLIKKAGRVFGKVYSKQVSIESGAFLNGSVEMEQENIDKIFSDMESQASQRDSSVVVGKPAVGHGIRVSRVSLNAVSPMLNMNIKKSVSSPGRHD